MILQYSSIDEMAELSVIRRGILAGTSQQNTPWMGLDIQPSVEQAIQGSVVRLVSIFVDQINQN
jgi:hypothetical protein